MSNLSSDLPVVFSEMQSTQPSMVPQGVSIHSPPPLHDIGSVSIPASSYKSD